MLEFKPYSFAALKSVLPDIKNSNSLCSEISAGSLYMWNGGYDVRFAVWNDTFIMSENIGEQPAFTWPIGKDISGMIDELIEYVSANNIALRFCEIDDKTLDIIKNDKRLKPATFAYEERWSDYIYSFSEALTFKGNKYKGQRNHINKYKRLYGDPVIRFVNDGDVKDIELFFSEYEKEHPGANSLEIAELEQTKKLLGVSDELGLYAACLKNNGKIAAVSIGEVVADTLLIHVEKALRRYEGIYPTMYTGFVNLIAGHIGRPLALINREDDSGDEGLRISKMQYHPAGRVNKHLVHIDSPAARISAIPVLKGEGITLTPFYPGDKKAYLKLNTDIENNRFWGYDYRDDQEIFGTIDENTFYDGALTDMKAGDSLNFAVRLSEEDEMIGEVILWNFTPCSAELGCRLMPKYQGRGYGKAAFKTAARFAKTELKVKVRAKCFVENTASYKMIISSGFKQTERDEKFFYFNLTE